MLRRAGTFRQGYYAPLSLPDATSHEDNWEQTWLHWVRQQSFKRYHQIARVVLFVLEIC